MGIRTQTLASSLDYVVCPGDTTQSAVANALKLSTTQPHYSVQRLHSNLTSINRYFSTSLHFFNISGKRKTSVPSKVGFFEELEAKLKSDTLTKTRRASEGARPAFRDIHIQPVAKRMETIEDYLASAEKDNDQFDSNA